MSSHEPIQSHRPVVAASNRAFGSAFSVMLLLISLWPWLRHGENIRFWALAASLIFGIVALFAAQLLHPFNRVWFKLGLALHALISPIIMAVLFYGAVTPMAVVLRLMGKDLLNLHYSKNATYWISRAPSGPEAGSMKNQY